MSLKICQSWIAQWVDCDIALPDLLDRLSLAGFESELVDSLYQEDHSKMPSIVIGHVDKVKAHPNAQRLQIAMVDIGLDEPIQIICGCPTLTDKLYVVVALHGAQLPALKIKKSKIRGETSHGMICSAEELGLHFSDSGIIHLEGVHTPGEDALSVLELNEPLIQIDVTPNRGDVLSLYGMAREIASILGIDVKPLKSQEIDLKEKGMGVSVSDACADICRRYSGVLLSDCHFQPGLPFYIRMRLDRAGIHAVNPLVDLLNYTMLLMGQPLHAFDMDKVEGKIIVRMANENEVFQTLSGNEIRLDEKTMVIADTRGVLAIAGVLGGLRAAITQETKSVYVESACFSPESVAYASSTYGIRTEASIRFERGVDSRIQDKALDHLCQMMAEYMSFTFEGGIDIKQESWSKTPPEILLDEHSIERLLGVMIAPDYVETILKSLGMQLTNEGKASWSVIAPTFRSDIQIAEDLIEEIVRIYGYDKLESKPYYPLPLQQKDSVSEKSLMERVYHCLVHHGMQQVVTSSFVQAEMQYNFAEQANSVHVLNPVHSELSVLRANLWIGLLDMVSQNLTRQHQSLCFYEDGICFLQNTGQTGIVERDMIAGVLYGKFGTKSWSETERDFDYYDIKAVVESLLEVAVLDDVEYRASRCMSLHPKQSSDIYYMGEYIGCCGMLHPSLLTRFKYRASCALFELDKKLFCELKKVNYTHFSKYPKVSRDIAIVVPNGVSYQDIKCVIQSICHKLLKSTSLFDIYTTGDYGDSGCSMGIRLAFQSNLGTLKDTEIEGIMQSLFEKLRGEYNVMVRGDEYNIN